MIAGEDDDRTAATEPELSTLSGESLDAALARRFVLVEERVELTEHQFTLRKPANADHLISEADYVKDERLPYWADLWPSSRVLAGALLTERGEGRSLLELGCGLGLTAIAAMTAGFSVTATDYYDDALHVTRANARRNVGREPVVRMVNWRDWPDDLGRFDVVVAADVLYERAYAPLVAACLGRSVRSGGEAVVADPGRLALPAFREAMASEGFEMTGHTRTPFELGPVKQEVQLLRFVLGDR